LSKADYIARSDAICQSASGQLTAVHLPADVSDGPATARYLQAAVANVRTEMTRLAALRGPAADAATLTSLRRQQAVTVAQLQAAAADYAAGRSAAGLAKLKPVAAGSQGQTAWESYGFKVCGRLSG
jgi:hypothetical protein